MIPRQPTLFALEDGLDIQVVDEDDLQFQHIQELLDSAVDSCIGLAPIYGLNVALKTLTLASNTRALVVHFHRVDKAWIGVSGDAQRLLENTVLRDASIVKYAFTADKLVYTLAHWYGVRVSSTLSLLPPQAKDEFEPWALENCVRGVSSLLSMNLLADLFIEREGKDTSQDDTVRQAWLAQYAGSSPARHSVPIVYDSSGLQYMHLQEASKLYCVSLQLRHLKPNVIENEIDEDVKVGTGGLDVTSARFKTRITQASIGQRLELMVSQGGREFSVEARTRKVEGRGARIAPTETLCDGVSIIHVKTHGREPPTNAEETRHRLLAGILQGNFTLFDNNHFVQTIFFPEQLTPWPALASARERKVRFSDRIFLNRSQGRAVEAIISLEDRHRVVLIHGPPGTGKTTVIAAGTNSIVDSDPNATVWLVAHSNVAVKNIAEKLLQSELLDFKIIVSKEFIFDWHEHLYQKFERNLIRTDSLPRDPYTAHRMLLGSRVILSTLSNLLNPNMMEVTAIAPVKTLIVDEASQIEVGDYLPVIHRFRYKLEKLVFIGDDKQLAPYGFEHIRELESIFEKRHLRMDAILLDTQSFMQPVLSGPGAKLAKRIQVPTISESKAAAAIAAINKLSTSTSLGLAPGFSKKGKIVALAVCDGTNAVILEFTGALKKSGTNKKDKPTSDSTPSSSDTDNDSHASNTGPSIQTDPRQCLQEILLCPTSPDVSITAFDLGPLAMALYIDLGLRITNAIDVQDAFSFVCKGTRHPHLVVQAALKSAQHQKIKPNLDRIEREFRNEEYDPTEVNHRKELMCRAWLAHFLVADCVDAATMAEIKRVNTQDMTPEMLNVVATISTDAHRLGLTKATTTTHRLTGVRNNDGIVKLDAASYKDKFRGDGLKGRLYVDGERGQYTLYNRINATDNGSGVVEAAKTVASDAKTKVLLTVETTGKDDPTLSESKRSATILRVLQGELTILSDNPWVRNIWFPSDGDDKHLLNWPAEWDTPPPMSPKPAPSKKYDIPKLNGSQQRAVNSMLSDKAAHRLVIVQGPPGTGKTSVIGAYVVMATQMGRSGIWLIAQSNVAVKNIALKLLSVGFKDWKILVARDFHNGWHEHLYTEDTRFKDHLILSSSFKKTKPRDLAGCKVILSTLSMLSNPSLHIFTKHIPIRSLIVDEASQIEIGSYIPAFTTFLPTLRKLCFIGDDKQLPPHGQEDLKSLRSVFEVSHLKNLVIFLNIQYRMPPELGNIISAAVYSNELQSNLRHPIATPMISCHFVDVPGVEAKAGTSWKNVAEQAVVLKLAKLLQIQNLDYRIITPYEGQTNGIENQMKEEEGLSWEDKCFNVDAFQGNEEDYIIISLVRSQGLGFLDNLRRTNVMLTRCKRGMFIITSRKFMAGVGGDSLVGELLDELEKDLGDKVWLSVEAIEKGEITTV
ncbi:hypothetical protein D9611_001793 [Ephemerocybe angulata]|uniref:Uncharacterized protein n=1 Tax=Ephemerocybe angulata TaxID=980116 RepID=A0A8H5CJP6_9AGAR|nr:hypothetical protein D9611_001793 [Tulosesus angulatus]